jgi:phytoene dehydrogenase-like protein
VAVDAVVIGAGPNGLVAATVLARAGWSVEVLERQEVAGGAVGSERTGRGYLHDWGSAFYGVLHASPVLRELGLHERVAWAHTRTPVSAVWDPERPGAVLRRTVDGTADGLGADGDAWRELVGWWHRLGEPLFGAMLGPVGAPLPLLRTLRRLSGPREAVQTARLLLEPVEAYVQQQFTTDAGRMLLAANATHADVGIDAAGSTPPALLLAMAAQVHGMPVPVGGASRLAEAMVEAAQEAGVVVRTGVDVTRVVVRGGRAVGVVTADGTGVAARRAVVADVAPTVLARDLVGEQHLPGEWLASLRRHRYTSGYFRLDVDLDRPAPWADERLRDSVVVHVTGDLDELALSQAEVRRGLLPSRPQLILGQQDRADPSRVPAGAASLWVECHCPGPPGRRAGRLGRAVRRARPRPAGGARPGPARCGRRHDGPDPARAAGPRPEPRRWRRRRRVGGARPAAGVPSGRRLVALRPAGDRPVHVRGRLAPGRRGARPVRAQRGDRGAPAGLARAPALTARSGVSPAARRGSCRARSASGRCRPSRRPSGSPTA